MSTRNRTGGVTGMVVVLLGALLACAADAAAQTETRFTIVDSSSSSWVARGYDNYTVTPANGWSFQVGRNFDNGITINLDGPPMPGTTVDYWRLNFAAPGDALLVPGHYADLQRYPFQEANRPGLEFAGTGRLDNQAAGFFDVLEATYGPAGQVLSFAANFTHYGETIANNYAIAEIRYNAAVPEPAGAAVIAGGLALLLRRRR